MDRNKRLMLEIISSTFCIDPRKMNEFTPTIFKNPHIQIPTVEEEKTLRDAGISIGVDKPLIKILVEMNKAGIKTWSSCQGHRAGEKGWIAIVNKDDIGKAKEILHKHGIYGLEIWGKRIEFESLHSMFNRGEYSEFDKYIDIAHDNGGNAQWPFLKDKYGITKQDVIDYADADQLQREKKGAKEHGLPFAPETFRGLSNMRRLIKLDRQGKGPTMHGALERIEHRAHNVKRRPIKRKSMRMIVNK
jgi:hypothetical protein